MFIIIVIVKEETGIRILQVRMKLRFNGVIWVC